MKNVSIPEYLQATVSMIQAAYPNGIPENEYLSLLVVLSPHMSIRNLADAISLSDAKRDHAAVYNDILKAATITSLSSASINQVQEKLTRVGFETWIKEE